MRRTVRLRPWQKRALAALDATEAADFLAVATPGAGKTTFALTAAIRDLGREPRRRVAVVAPTAHLKTQWSRAAAGLGLHLAAEWRTADGRIPADLHGVVLTYQQVAADPDGVRQAVGGSFAIFDELHHAGEERAWGDALRHAFESASQRLSLSGTPFRSDSHAIPFVRYDGDEAEADFVYGYADALAEGGVVRPVRFPRVDGEMEWTAPDGMRHSHTFTDRLDRVRAGQRLRTALSPDGDWLPEVLERAHGQLLEARRLERDAGALAIAMDQEHARAVAGLIAERIGVRPVVAVSDDPDASARIARFAEGADPWIVAVRMVSEGVDIPRLRVGVFATNVVTELFFRQAVGRLVRSRPGVPAQPAHLFIPDDERLRTYAARIAEERRHTLRRRDAEDVEEGELDEAEVEQVPPESDDAQLSLFNAISARALGDPAVADPDGVPSSASGGASTTAGTSASPLEQEPGVGSGVGDDTDGLVLDLEPPPLAGAPGGASAHGGPGDNGVGPGPTRDGRAMTREEHKRTLRDTNARRARDLVRLTGKTHQQVNAELNRLAGVRRVTEATLEQLERRAEHARRWLQKL